MLAAGTEVKRKPIESIAKSSSIAGLIAVAAGICQSILLVPLFLKGWGPEKYGLWASLFALISLLHAITVGFQTYAGNEFGKIYHLDINKARGVLGSALRAILFFGALELLVFAVLVISGGAARMFGLEPNDQRLMGLYAGVVCFGISWLLFQGFGGLLIRVIMPIGEYSRSVYFGILLQAVQIGVLLAATLGRWSIFATCATMAIGSAAFSIYVINDIRKRMPQVYPWWQFGTLKDGLQLASRSITISAATVMEQFGFNGVTLLVASMLGPVLVPVWFTSRTIVNLGFQASNQLLNPMFPEMVRFHAHREGEKLAQVIQASWLIVTIVIIVPMTIASPLLATLYTYWTAGELTLDRRVFVFLTAGLCLNITARPYFFYLYGLNAVRAQIAIATSRMGLLLIVSVVSAPVLGLTGFATGVCAAELGGGLLCRQYARQYLREFDGNPPLRVESLAWAIGLCAAAAMASYLFLPEYKWISAAIAVSILTGLILLQWRSLSQHVRQRIQNSILPAGLRTS